MNDATERPGHHRGPWGPSGQGWGRAGPPWGPGGWRRRGAPARAFGCAVLALILGTAVLTALATWLAGVLLGLVNPSLQAPAPVALVALVVVVVTIVAVARIFGRTAWRVGDLVTAAERLGDGEPEVRVAVQGPGPYRRLAVGFNAMAERIDRSRERERALLADVTHELRTPLTVVGGGLEAMLDGVRPRDDDTIRPLLDQTRVMARLVEDLRTLSLTDVGALPLHREPTDVASLVADVVRGLSPAADEAGIVLELDGVPVPAIEVDPVRIREVVGNLVANAIRHTPEHGRVTVGIRESGDWISIVVRDDGDGIDPDELPRVFERFYRGAASRGSGLGLTIARDLVTAHGGTLSARSDGRGRGTEMRVELPIRG